MRFSFHPQAEEELFAAIEYYEECESGLGQAFLLEVMTAIANVTDFPTAWTKVDNDVRRCLTHRFPYAILFSIEEDTVLILAVMHLKREPGYWRSRLS